MPSYNSSVDRAGEDLNLRMVSFFTCEQEYSSVFKAKCNTSMAFDTPVDDEAAEEEEAAESLSTILRLHSERVKKDSLSTVRRRRQHSSASST